MIDFNYWLILINESIWIIYLFYFHYICINFIIFDCGFYFIFPFFFSSPLYVLVRLSQHVLSATDTGSFLSVTFGSALVQVKRAFDRFFQTHLRSIEESRPSKKSKCEILPFVSNFEVNCTVHLSMSSALVFQLELRGVLLLVHLLIVNTS